MFHGFGKLKFPSGQVFEGNWDDGYLESKGKSPIQRAKSIVDKSLISDVRVRDIFILPTVISIWDSLHMDKSQVLGSFTKMGIWLLKDFGWMENFLAKITISTKRKSKCWPKKIGWKEAWKNPESRILSGNRWKKYQKSTNPSTKKRQIKIWLAKSKFWTWVWMKIPKFWMGIRRKILKATAGAKK